MPADIFDGDELDLNGIPLVLSQQGNQDECTEWHLHQDFVIALKLKREGNIWLAMDEGYGEVVRLRKTSDGEPSLLEVRAEYPKDYLCARAMALYVSFYRNRQETVDDATHINWSENPVREINHGDRWERRVITMHEGGNPFGSSTAVFRVGRNDIDFDEDLPSIGPSDSNLVSDSWTVTHKGQKVILVEGEFWRNEWVNPAERSTRIRGDEFPSSVFFVTDASGTRESKETLEYSGSWLWFRPEAIMALSHRRGGGLGWYTRDTGHVRCSPGSDMTFGVNRLGLVNVFAKDIALLPEWQQRLWAGFNISPEAGVSEELLASQAQGMPASTQAPEEFLRRGIDLLNAVTLQQFGFRLFTEHEQYEKLVSHTQRFRSVDQTGFFSLAKDVARLTADSIDASALQKIVAPPKGEKLRSLKSLESVLAAQSGSAQARLLLGPLAGAYDLRHADAHLPGSDLEPAYILVGVDRTLPFVTQGYQLLRSCVSSMFEIAKLLKGVAQGIPKQSI
ncbi:MAG: hypothetical protein ACR2JB_21830 [Bryobacteraceae bacterium]